VLCGNRRKRMENLIGVAHHGFEQARSPGTIGIAMTLRRMITQFLRVALISQAMKHGNKDAGAARDGN
jgi:hypothetical protein